MAYKDILVYADTIKSARSRLELAASIARSHDARLVALHVSTPAYIPVDVGGAMPASLIEWQEEYQREQAEEARKLVDTVGRRTGQDIEYRLVLGDLLDMAMLHCSCADVVVVSQSDIEGDEPSMADILPEEIVLGTGRPVIVVPRYGTFQGIGQRVLVAWNRTREAARAVHDSLPILRRAASVVVMEVVDDGADASPVSGADISAHLARHGAKVEFSSMTSGDIEIGDVILSRAADLSADLIVMGAYGHSRLREFALGGATREILQHMTVPVLMSH